jgi:hypothetical protein
VAILGTQASCLHCLEELRLANWVARIAVAKRCRQDACVPRLLGSSLLHGLNFDVVVLHACE